MNLVELRENRATRVAEMRGIVDKADAEKRDLSGEERTRFDQLKTEVAGLEDRISRAQALAEMERRADATPLNGPAGRELEGLEHRFSIGKAIGEYAASGRLTGAEAEWANEHRSGRASAIAIPSAIILGERRALLTTTPADGPGGNLVATTLGPFIDRNRPLLAVEALGATVLSGLVANLDLPKLKSSGAVGWVAEHAPVARSDPRFDKVSMGPKTVGGEYEMSRRMLIQAPQLESILRRDLGLLLAGALDRAAIIGGGANEPRGIMSTPGVQLNLLGANGGALTVDTAADMIGAIDASDAEGARGFLTNTRVKKVAMKLKDANNQPFGVTKVFQEEPVKFSSQVPSDMTRGTGTNLSAILYGTWADVVIGYWSAIDLVLNPYHSDVASKGGALLHAFLDADVGIRRPENFVVTQDVITA